MITRDVAQLEVVPALVHHVRFHSCTVTGFTCYTDGATSAIGTSEFFPGFVIDRLGLSQSFKSMMVAPVLYAEYGGSGDGTGFVLASLSAGIMHASASGGTFAAYSTGNWLVEKSLWRTTTATSTASLFFARVQNDVGLSSEIGLGGAPAAGATTATSTAAGQGLVAGTSSTGVLYYAGPGPIFDLGGAKRYIKCVLRARFETTACGSGGYHMSAAAIFGQPDLAQPSFAPSKRVLVTTGCAT